MRSSYAFLTERARSRAPQIVDYAAAPGAAFVVAPGGAVVLAGGAATDADVEHIARLAAALSTSHDAVSFAHESTCVHAVPVRGGWTLCVLSTTGLSPALVAERTKKAAYVLGLALVDAGPARSPSGGGAGGAPAEARVFAPSRKKD
jgi:hypothetical protein